MCKTINSFKGTENRMYEVSQHLDISTDSLIPLRIYLDYFIYRNMKKYIPDPYYI